MESPSLEISESHLDKVLCSLLWVTLLGQGVGLGDPQRSLPTPTMLWFCGCDCVILWDSFYFYPSCSFMSLNILCIYPAWRRVDLTPLSSVWFLPSLGVSVHYGAEGINRACVINSLFNVFLNVFIFCIEIFSSWFLFKRFCSSPLLKDWSLNALLLRSVSLMLRSQRKKSRGVFKWQQALCSFTEKKASNLLVFAFLRWGKHVRILHHTRSQTFTS